MADYDVVIIGAGAAGLTLAHRIGQINDRRDPPLRTAVLEPPSGPHTPPPRTWCYWESGPGRWDHLLAASWADLSVIGPDGGEHRSSAGPYVYKMLRSADLDAHVRSSASDGVEFLPLLAHDTEDGPEHATVRALAPGGDQVDLTARWVFDSRPPGPPRGGRTHLLQHFRGWFVRLPEDTLDPFAAVLMDLRPPQPRHGVAFGYVLPLSGREALVEYTEFGRAALTTDQYERALTDYCEMSGFHGFEVTASEQGAIPMTDARLPARVGRRLFRIGAAGGATRPSTGYTFSGTARQTAAIARALELRRVPVPPAPHHSRHLAMDAVMLRALDSGRVSGADFFARLFAANRLGDVLAFLDGDSLPVREFAMGLTTPVGAMSLSTADHLWHTLRSVVPDPSRWSPARWGIPAQWWNPARRPRGVSR
ncbi:lycopene cyclase family protein [Nocardiopsis prasina]|uniref:lycopene cyclase family protein n=1 Tax=Nocardiopsis prasina TaxID=2015 RepID=UPI00034CE643|nr:lycopene cyclase family protein [Nocardiopsis prasina]